MSATHAAINPAPPQKTPTRGSSLKRFAYGAAAIAILIRMLAFLGSQPSPGTFFGTYWVSGRAAAHGLDPFVTYPESGVVDMTAYGGIGPIREANLNPPWLLPVLQGASHLSLRDFCVAWTLTSFVILLATVALLMRRHGGIQTRQVLWLLLCTPTMEVFWSAQIYFPMFLLAAIAWNRLDRDDWLAAVAIGLVAAIRPTFLYWPLFLLLRRDYRLALRSLGVFFVVNLLALPFYGLRVYREWFAVLHDDPHWASPMNVALPATCRRLQVAPVGWLLAVTLALAAAWFVWYRKPRRTTVSGIALGCVMLCAPLAWISYLLPMMPGLVTKPWGRWSSAAAGALLIPAAIPVFMAWKTTRLEAAAGASIYILPIAILTVTSIRHFRKPSAGAVP